MLTLMTLDSPLGVLRLFARGAHLTGVYLPIQPAPESGAEAEPVERGTSPVLARAAAQLTAYFAGERDGFDVPLAPVGTAFQRAVWHQLAQIPFGVTRTYGELARGLGKPTGARAVGAANGKNPISILVPCHRVIAGTGALTGYAGGIAAKEWLLSHERAARRGCA